MADEGVAEFRFSESGPFDDEERATIVAVIDAVGASEHQAADRLLDVMRTNARQLDRFAEVLCDYPTLFGSESLGSRKRDLNSLVDLLSRSNVANFDMFLPTRALLAGNLILGEVNFYRLLRFVCDEALPSTVAESLKARVDRSLCHCLYARLAEEVLRHIASDPDVSRTVRERAVLALTNIWERVKYRVDNFFPVLQATWEARRRVPTTLGTLMGTSEMFALIGEGCDERFVDYLVRDERTADEVAAFREFLFGATTEQLGKMEQHMASSGKGAICAADIPDDDRPCDPCAIAGDPALAMFEFFLSRHLQAAARRLAHAPGPKRTAEEYVLMYYLEAMPNKSALGMPSG